MSRETRLAPVAFLRAAPVHARAGFGDFPGTDDPTVDDVRQDHGRCICTCGLDPAKCRREAPCALT